MRNFQITEEGLDLVLDIQEALGKLEEHFPDISISDMPDNYVSQFFNMVTDDMGLNVYNHQVKNDLLQSQDIILDGDKLDEGTLKKYLGQGYIEKVFNVLDEFVDHIAGNCLGPNKVIYIRAKLYELMLSPENSNLTNWFGPSNHLLTPEYFEEQELSLEDINWIDNHMVDNRPNPTLVNDIAQKIYNYAIANNIIETDGGRRK